MSSNFQHVVHALGGGVVKFAVGSGPPPSPVKSQHLLVNDQNEVYAATSGTPVSWQGGLPFDVNGRVLITQSDTVARVGVGATPYDANGRVAVGGETTHHNHGVAYSATGALAGAVSAGPTNLWGPTNVRDYGGVLGTEVTPSGLNNNNFNPPDGTNFASWQGPCAQNKTHQLRIDPLGSEGTYQIRGVDTGIILTSSFSLEIGTLTTLNITMPFGECGWLIVTANEGGAIATGSWLVELYEI